MSRLNIGKTFRSVPLQAINHENDKTTVFVVNRDGVVEDRPVILGIQTATDAEVISGLARRRAGHRG